MEPLDIHIQQKKKANRITLAHTAIAAGLGFAPFPLLDAASILGIQVWMLGRLARTYDLPFNTDFHVEMRPLISGVRSTIKNEAFLK